ncbi:MAG: hypothetical protein A2756_05445 [Candidatus Ryanbacteria bacterium RIFCSPHIGHO2_01_FULL_48_27]|uniref:Reverse transcriptase domain-containing protein n=1 Tax=Candidatus Ryanbacteria bacterium RIFCSPHIGHO2_01_FULL_48_27 TaxID=1802115 RepID=A0A1G2G554_9BACT|nr:MAG: hypothetical protein A2756_05445 [Candidatus Ryanbacteria bacterium RIFCSPHIGHO2_01_FULL_48_27]
MKQADFVSICGDKQLWDWMRKDSIYPYPSISLAGRESYLKKLYQRVNKRLYYPQPALDYLSLNKGKGVLRVVPVLSLDDLCVYYYCARKLEKFIAKNRVSTTFGGFGLSGKLRRLEDAELDRAIQDSQTKEVIYLDDEYGYSVRYIFGARKWYHEWGDFNRKLYFCCLKNSDGYAAQVDISNFYDSISLDSLEYKLRKVVGASSSDIVYLLMHLLRYWNRHIYFYRQQGVGLPQDLFGECSRILANHFLQTYDKSMSSFCRKLRAQYFRYADDQFFLANNKEILELIIAKASSLLMKEGLNFNQKKVNVSTIKKLKKSFAFRSFSALAGKPRLVPALTTQRMILFYLRNRKNLRKEGLTLLRRILTVLFFVNRRMLKLSKLKRHLLSASFLSSNYFMSSRDLTKIYAILNAKEKARFLRIIEANVKKCLYTYYLYEARKFYGKHNQSTRLVSSRIAKVRALYKFER